MDAELLRQYLEFYQDLGFKTLCRQPAPVVLELEILDRKSTRLNSSHLVKSYAVFCLNKKSTTLSRTLGRILEDTRCMPAQLQNILEPGGTEVATAAGGARRYRILFKSFRGRDIHSIFPASFGEWI